MPKFDAESAVGAIEQYAVTSFITVPAIMASLISVIRYLPVSIGTKLVLSWKKDYHKVNIAKLVLQSFNLQ